MSDVCAHLDTIQLTALPENVRCYEDEIALAGS